MTQFGDMPGVTAAITPGGAPSPTVDVVGKMLWLEGFAYPIARGDDGGMHYAVVTKDHIALVLENLYQVQTPANLVIRWLRQAGLIQYADALAVPDGLLQFRYVCARAARDKAPKTIEDVDRLVATIANVRAFLGPQPADPRDVLREQQELDEALEIKTVADLEAAGGETMGIDIIDRRDAPKPSDYVYDEDPGNIHDHQCPAHFNAEAACNCPPF